MQVVPVRNSRLVQTVPSPIGGLNVIDNLMAMSATDAIRLDNFVSQPYGCTVRKGYQIYASGIAGPVESLGGWFSKAGSNKLFAFGDKKFFDVTTPGPVGAPLLSALTTDFWQNVCFANSAGSHTIFVNGLDDPILYNLSGVQRLTAGDGIVVNTIAGVNPNNFIQATVHQRRLWFTPTNDTRGWFLPPDAIYGVANYFDFGPFFKKGGYLAALATWTIDAGAGANDKLVAVSSNGEAVVFEGTDVTSAATWRLAGVFFVGIPVRGRRFYVDIVGDLLLLTRLGIVSMTSMLASTQVNQSDAAIYSKKIQFLLSSTIEILHDLEGWELAYFPATDLFYINVPSVFMGANAQIVNNTINNTWATFSGMDARCWFRFDGMPFYGDADGNVIRSWYGTKDAIPGDGDGGTNIIASVQQAYTNFAKPGVQKQVGLYRLSFLLQERIGYVSQILYDYQQPTVIPPPGSALPSTASLWGSAIWAQSLWSGGLLTQRQWRSAQGVGEAISVLMALSTQVETTWVGTDFTLISGGPL